MQDLKLLIPYLDEIMQSFYTEMLSHEQLSVFFEDEHATTRLIEKQKQNFIESLDDTPEQLESRFRRLGVLHYDIKVPSTDFLKSTKIWKSSFIHCAIRQIGKPELIIKIEDYFDNVDNSMCRGYLDKQLEADVADINILIESYRDEYNIKSETINHLNWLRKILHAIQSNDLSAAPELDADKCEFHDALKNPSRNMLMLFSKEHFIDLHERLHIDTRSLFLFITKNDYPEILSLYANLLSVYKITLVAIGNLSLEENIKNLHYDLFNQKGKEKIYIATLHSSQHIINNLLNQLSIIRPEIDKHRAFDSRNRDMFDDMVTEATTLLKKLASVQDIDEDSIKYSVSPEKNN